VERPERRDPLDVAWASLALLVPTIVSLLSRMGAIDLAYHIRAGEDVLHGNIPRVDTYTFTVAGTPWLDQQWLAQGVFAALYRLGGWPLLAAAQALLVGATFSLVYLAARATGASSKTGALLVLAGFLVASPGLGMRPQLLALPLFAALLWVTASRREHPGRLWVAPVLAARSEGSSPVCYAEEAELRTQVFDHVQLPDALITAGAAVVLIAAATAAALLPAARAARVDVVQALRAE